MINFANTSLNQKEKKIQMILKTNLEKIKIEKQNKNYINYNN